MAQFRRSCQVNFVDVCVLLKPVQVRGLYDGWVVDVATVKIHAAVDAGNTAVTGVLPEAVWHLAKGWMH